MAFELRVEGVLRIQNNGEVVPDSGSWWERPDHDPPGGRAEGDVWAVPDHTLLTTQLGRYYGFTTLQVRK